MALPFPVVIKIVNGIITTICKHIYAKKSLPRTRITIRINKPMILRVIVSTLQVVEPRLGIIIISAIPERIHFRQITLGRNYLAPRGVNIFRLQDTAFVNDLHHVALQIEDVIIGIGGTSLRRVVERKWTTGFVVEKVQCRGFHRGHDDLADDFSALREILMRHRLGRHQRTGCIRFRTGFHRLTCIAAHDLWRIGRLRRNDCVFLPVSGHGDVLADWLRIGVPICCITIASWQFRIVTILQNISIVDC